MPIINYIYFFFLFLSLNISLLAQVDEFSNTKAFSEIEIEELIKQMANDCWRLREINSDSSLRIGIDALNLAKKHGVSHKFPRLNNYVGVVYIHYLNDTKSAIPYFHHAMEYSMMNNDSIQLAYTYNNLGDAFMLTGNAPLAHQYAEKSMAIFKKLNNKSGIAYGYINLGLVYRIEKNYPLSLKCFNQAKEIREEIGDSMGIASVIWELARTNQDQENLDIAMELFQESYIHHLAINNFRYTAYCLNGMADIYYLNKEYDLAAEYFMRSRELNESRNHYFGIIDDKIGLALVFAKQKKIVKGETCLREALEIASSMSMYPKILETHEAYAEFYQILKKYKKSTESLNQFVFLYDSILSIQQFETLNEIQNNFLISQNLSQARQEIETRKNERKYLLIIIALMIILVGVFIWRLWSRRTINLQLQQLNQTKDKLFSVISHDLRSPFNSLIGFNELLLEDLEKGVYKNASKYAGIINISAKEGLRLLTNLLNWSQAQRGRIKFNPKNISIEELFNELQDFFDASTNKSRIKLSFSSTIKSNISGDTDILRTVLINLISNAIKYTEDGGLIEVEAQKVSSQIFIRVKDNGTGMDTTTLENLFDKTKITQSTVGLRNEKGTGLGLSICEELINIHNGSLRATSTPGEGSLFEIKFPED